MLDSSDEVISGVHFNFLFSLNKCFPLDLYQGTVLFILFDEYCCLLYAVELQCLEYLWDRSWAFVLDMGSSSQWGLIKAPGQGANGDNLRMSFQSSIKWWFVEWNHQNRLEETILRSTHNIHFHGRKSKFLFNIPKYVSWAFRRAF